MRTQNTEIRCRGVSIIGGDPRIRRAIPWFVPPDNPRI
jgi:hypothetical protein